MLREKTLALATRWARCASKDSYSLATAGILAAHGLVFLALSALPAISSLALALAGLFALGTAMCLFERAGFIELLNEAETGESDTRDPGRLTDGTPHSG